MVRLCGSKGKRSGFSARSTAEEVTRGVDGRGLVAIITGASSGIGAETARVLASRGVHVFLAVRNIDAGQNVKEAIIKDNPIAKVDVMKLELASQSSIQNFVLEFNSLNLPLNILINNAGIYRHTFLLSQYQIELHFATNHLGHFLLTNLLLEKMKTTAQESKVEGRIVNVSSEGHRTIFRGITFEKINHNSCYNGWNGYPQSKLANILHTNELSRRLKEERVQITANSIHPGVIATNILRNSYIVKRIIHVICAFTMKNVQQGAATTCYVALNPQVQGVTGKYFCDCNESTPSCVARDSKLAAELWDFSMTLIK